MTKVEPCRATDERRVWAYPLSAIRYSLLLLLTSLGPAADKSGVSPNSISLPKGPGSIEGLGESFQPSLNTGTAKYGISLKLPPGVAGQQPSLVLSYEGGGGNGPLGFGWNLSLPSIQRRTDKGIPTYGAAVGFPRADIFINEAKEELVPQADGFFFSKNEGAFVRYRFFPSHPAGEARGEGHWEATQPDGTKLLFGISATGRIEESSSARIFCWLLERETDTRGNVIEYSYRSFAGPENLNQKYLATIRYGPGAPAWTHFHFVSFAYEDRADWFEDGRAGFLVRTGKRLKSIFVGTQGVQLNGHLAGDFDGDGTTDFLNRRYDLEYLRYAGNASHWSLLETVTLVGADGVTALPPARHAYNVCDPPAELSAQNSVMGGLNEPPAVMDNELVDLIDLNADGLPDVFRTQSGGGVHRVWLNQGPKIQPGGAPIQWSAGVQVEAGTGTAWSFDLASEQTHLADMDGDGLADLVRKGTDESVFYFPNRGKLGWGERQEMSVQDSAPPAPFGRPDVRTADLDFDKRMDVVQSVPVGDGVLYRIWFNLGEQTYSPAMSVGPVVGFDLSLPSVQITDCNGDRVPDLARVQPSAVVVAAGLGYGEFAESKTIPLPDTTLEVEHLQKAKLTDINGDGLADLVLERAGPGLCWYWLNLGNYTFSARKTIVDLPGAISPSTVVRWADLNGNGTIDLIYADSLGTPRLQAIEIGELLNCGAAPNTLVEIDNGIGRVTRIAYAPSTRFALEDAAAGRPWPDSLPFPVTVVSTITVSDSLGHEYVTRFRYHDGYYDPVEKQFRGFAQAEQIDLGDPSAPTPLNRSYFDTGREFEAMKGRLLSVSAETEDGRVFSEETTTWANPPRTLMVGTNGLAVRFAHPVASVKQILELGRGAPRRLESEVGYDDYGNQTRSANYGIVEGGDRTAFDDERITLTEYAINTNAWILRPPKRMVTQDENGALIARSESFYDDETFSGNNFGSVTIGNLTLQRAWINPSSATAFVRAARTKYDLHGNPIAAFDPLADDTGTINQGHFRELVYDTRFHSYPIRETIHIGNGKPTLVFQATYDEGLATMLSSTDFNSHTTTYTYDALARLTTVVKPSDTAALPTAEYDYALAVPVEYWSADGLVRRTGMVNHVETRQLDRAPGSAGAKRDHYLISRQFSDGLGRPLMTRSEAEPAPGQATPRVVVSGVVLFNARQKPSRALNPFFTLQTGSPDELLTFENIEAAGWSGQFHENGSLVALTLAAAHQSSTEYDATLRTLRTTNPDGTQSRTEYEPLVTRAFDENDTDPASPHVNTPMVNISDGLGRLIRVDELVHLNDDGTPSGAINTWTTRYQYDLNDCLTRITDSQNNVKLMRYDSLKRKTFMNDPDCGISANVFDDASNLTESVDAKNQRITYTYDGANRVLTEDYHDENSPEFSYHRSPDVTYHYDQAAPSVDQGDGTQAAARNVKGTLAYVEDTSGEEHSSFDNRGRQEWIVKRIPDPSIQNSNRPLVSFRTALDYDSLDRITRVVYPDNDQISYRYNARNLLERIIGGPSGDIIPAVSYLPSAQPAQCDYGNGLRTTYAYDLRARLTRLSTLNPQPSTELIHFTYDFDAVSNIKAIHDQRPASAVALADKRRNSQTFTYDDLYRPIRVQYNLPTPSTNNGGEINYRYDRLGNMLVQASDITHLEKGFSVTDLGNMTYGGAAGRSNRVGRQPNDPPGPHALTSIQHPVSTTQNRGFPYDANGNMANIDGLACTWDFLDRLVAVEDEKVRAEYAYDYTGRRITKRVIPHPASGEGLTPTIYVGKHFEVRDHDQPTKYVFNGSTRVARITGSLSTNTRIQRFRLGPGWNLLSLAINASDLSVQLQRPGIVTSVYSWNPQTGNYLALVPGAVPAGTVFWVKATTNATIGVLGTYSDPVNRQVAAGATYIASTGLEAWTPDFPLALATWSFNPQPSTLNPQPTWHARLTGDLSSVNDLPRTFAPGQALYVIANAPFELEVPDPALRIRYYHQDHLGSSSAMTDANGALVEETAFYPFGIPRHEHRLRQIDESYKFTQKERDRESGLHYFEARYLAGSISRFLSVDPLYAKTESSQDDPQALNLYAYVRNNPLQYTDPTGRNPEIANAVALQATRAARDEEGGGWLGALTPGVSFVVGASDALSWGMGPSYQVLRPTLVEGYKVDTDSAEYTGGNWCGQAVTIAATLMIPVPKVPAAPPGTVTLFSKTPVAPVIAGAAGGRPGGNTQGTGGAVQTWPGGASAPAKPMDPNARAAARKAKLDAMPVSPQSAWFQGMVDTLRAKREMNHEIMGLIANMAELLFRK